MKLLWSAILSFSFCFFLVRCSNVSAEKDPTAIQTTASPADAIEGVWKLVWASRNDTVVDMSNHTQIKMFQDGAFSLFAHDPSGKLKFSGYGKYNFEGDTYHETFLYHNHTPFIGGEDWQQLSVRGDTMYLDGFTKVVVGGKDMSAGWPQSKEKLLRVKW